MAWFATELRSIIGGMEQWLTQGVRGELRPLRADLDDVRVGLRVVQSVVAELTESVALVMALLRRRLEADPLDAADGVVAAPAPADDPEPNRCPSCGFVAGNAGGLASHQRARRH